jgi:mannose-1-phosphate guanylyltransferase
MVSQSKRGEGTRLRPLVRQLCGDERPKQFFPLLGTSTLLRQTLDRVEQLIPPERTVVVTLQAHARYLEAAFMEHVGELVSFVEREPRQIVLVGAPPTQPETEYGWIEPGTPVGWTSRGPVHAIQRFREKPSKGAAEALLRRGSLWNTFVFVARAAVVLSAGRQCAPALYDRLAALRVVPAGEPGRWAVRQAYALAPTVDFSRSILEACPQMLAVSTLPGLIWCDLGSPERVVEMLDRLGVSAPWLATYTA